MFLGRPAVSVQSVFRIRNWRQLVSRNKAGSRAGGLFGRMSAATLGSVGGLKSLVRRRLLKLPRGLAAYGVWILLVSLAAETSVPGVFLDDDGTPLTLEDLSLLTDVSLEEIGEALDVLSRPEVRLIESVSLEEALAVPVEPAVGQLPEKQSETPTPTLSSKEIEVATVQDVAQSRLAALDQPAGPSRRSTGPAPELGVPSSEDGDPARNTSTPVPNWLVGELSGASRPVSAVEPNASVPLSTVSAPLSEAKPPEIDKLEKQFAQLAGICQQVDQMKLHVAAMTNGGKRRKR